MFLVAPKVIPRVGKAQNGRLEKQPKKTDMKNFKNVDSKMANLILNEIIDRYVEAKFQQYFYIFVSVKCTLHYI